jgi:hypothetical protein
MKRKDISDYNSLKNQQKQSKVFKKYNRILKTKPSNLQQYYYYLQNKQPILDELNYLSNTQIANAKNEVAKQLENATILNDKFKLKLEEDKKRAEEETKQRKARQEEIFKRELFEGNIRDEEFKKNEAAKNLSNAFKRAPIRQDYRNTIGEKRFNEAVKLRDERKAKAAEVLKGLKVNDPLEIERLKQEAVKNLSNKFKRAPIERNYKELVIRERYNEAIKKFDDEKKERANPKIKTAEPKFELKRATEQQLLRQQRPPRVKLSKK